MESSRENRYNQRIREDSLVFVRRFSAFSRCQPVRHPFVKGPTLYKETLIRIKKNNNRNGEEGNRNKWQDNGRALSGSTPIDYATFSGVVRNDITKIRATLRHQPWNATQIIYRNIRCWRLQKLIFSNKKRKKERKIDRNPNELLERRWPWRSRTP